MDLSTGESPTQQIRPGKLPLLPHLWAGYLLGFATVVAELIDPSLHSPNIATTEIPIPNLYLYSSYVRWRRLLARLRISLSRRDAACARLEAPHFAGPGGRLPFHPYLQPLLGVQVAAGDCTVRKLEVRAAGDEAANGGPHGFRRVCHAFLV